MRVDPHLGDDLAHVTGPVCRAVVVVDPLRNAVLLERAPEDELERGQVPLEAPAAVEDESAVVVQERVQVGTTGLPRLVRIRQPGTHEHVGLPEVVGRGRFEAIEVLGVRDPGQPGREPGALERAMKRAASDQARLHGLRVLEDPQDPVERALGDVELELAGELDHRGRQHGAATRRTLLVGQAAQAVLAVAPHPGADGLGGGLEGLAVGVGPDLLGEVLEQRSTLAAVGVEGQVGADHLVANQRLRLGVVVSELHGSSVEVRGPSPGAAGTMETRPVGSMPAWRWSDAGQWRTLPSQEEGRSQQESASWVGQPPASLGQEWCGGQTESGRAAEQQGEPSPKRPNFRWALPATARQAFRG